uniref:SFRICE_016618 n=1 Tax=Spodoptera frugiperda TaxID=7108 RepID=A0A2H1VBX2_SPOFR
MRQKLQKTRTKHSTIKQELTTFQPGYSGDIYRRRLSYTSDNRYQYPMLRNMKPITSIQRRFKIVTPHRHMLRLRSTRSYIVNLISRPTKEVTTKLRKAKKTNQVTTRFPLFHEAIRFRSHLNQNQATYCPLFPQSSPNDYTSQGWQQPAYSDCRRHLSGHQSISPPQPPIPLQLLCTRIYSRYNHANTGTLKSNVPGT